MTKRMSLMMAGVLLMATAAEAANRAKANNSSNLNVTASWVGGVVPGANDVGVWSNTVAAASDVQLGADLNLGGLAVFNPGGSVYIGGTNLLTLGVFGIDLTRAQQPLTLAPEWFALLTNAGVSLNVTNGQVLTLNPTNFTRASGALLIATNLGAIATATLTNDGFGQLGTWARLGSGTSASYAAVSGGVLAGYTGTAAATAADVVDTSGVTNYDVAAGGAVGPGASFHTLRYTGAAGGIGGDFTADGLLNAGTGALAVSNAVTIGAARELVLTAPDTTRAITLHGPVVDHGSGASGITIAGGRVNLNASNSYNGATVVAAGLLVITNANALGTTNGPTIIHATGSVGNNGGQLALDGSIVLAEPIQLQGPGDGAFGQFSRSIDTLGGTNTITGTITLSGGQSYRIASGAGVLNVGLIQRATAAGGNLILDPNAGSVLNVNTPIDNNLGQLTCHAGGLVVLNASGNDLGQAVVQNLTSLRVTAPDALGTNQNLLIGQGPGNTASGLNNDAGTFILNANQTINILYGTTNGVTNAAATDKRRITSTATNAVTLTVGNGNGSGTFDGIIDNGTNGATVALAKVGTGTQTLSGTRPNTHTGPTTISAGGLTLAKSTGTNSVGGSLIINAGTLTNLRGEQIADTATVTMTATNSSWNLGGFTETIGQFDVQNANPGVAAGFFTGGGGRLTVTGTLTHVLGNLTINSGGAGAGITAGSVVNLGGSWTFGTASGATQFLLVGTGGLTVGGGSTLQADAAASAPNYIALDGDVTSLTNAVVNTIAGTAQLRLNGVRTFDVADGAAAIDLSVGTPVTDGTSAGTLNKTGAGVLQLAGSNSYSGVTIVNAGTVVIASTNALPGWDTPGRYLVASGATLAVSGGINDGAAGTILGSGNFTAGGQFGFDTTAGNRTYVSNLADTGAGTLGLVKLGSNTLTLSGTNTYSGTTLVAAGILTIASTGALPGFDTNGRYWVASNATLAAGSGVPAAAVDAILATTNFAGGANIGFDTASGSRGYAGTIANSVNGLLGLVKLGSNTLTLGGTNTYDGVTTIQAGTLLINSPYALGSTNGATVINCNGNVTNGGQLSLSGGITIAEPLLFTGGGDASPYVASFIVAAGGGTNRLTGPVSLLTTGSARMTAGGAGTVLLVDTPIVRTNNSNGLILGAGGSGGAVIVNQPLLLNGGPLTLHNGPGTILLNTTNHIGVTSVQYQHVLRIGTNDALATNANLLVGQVSADPNAERGTFDLAGFNQTINGLLANGTNAAAHPGTRVVTNSAATQSTLTIGSGNATGSFHGTLAGDVVLRKVGTGVQYMSGTNTATGATVILGGTLALTNEGSLASTSILVGAGAQLVVTGRLDTTLTLAAGQKLGGSGLVQGLVINEGEVAPGASAGVLTIRGDYAQTTGALSIELGGTAPGTGYDRLVVSNTAALNGALTVTLINGFAPAAGHTFTILQGGGLLGTFATVNLPAVAPGLGWDLSYAGNAVTLSVTGAPSGYLAYAAQITNAAERGLQRDPDGDGYANLLEYATGGNPTNVDAAAKLHAIRATNGVFALRFLRNTNAVDALLVVEGAYAATNEAMWTSIAVNSNGAWSGAAVVSEDASSPANVTVQDTDPAATNRFLRLRVVAP